MSRLLEFDGTVFTDPAGFAADDEWHAEITRLRASDRLQKIDVDDFASSLTIAKHTDILEIERPPELFQNTVFAAPVPRLYSAEIIGPVERSHGQTTAGIKHLPIRFRFTGELPVAGAAKRRIP